MNVEFGNTLIKIAIVFLIFPTFLMLAGFVFGGLSAFLLTALGRSPQNVWADPVAATILIVTYSVEVLCAFWVCRQIWPKRAVAAA